MGKITKLQGEATHLEKVHRSEGDERRHSHNCMYFAPKNGGYCILWRGKCKKAAHCMDYKKRTNEIVKEPLYYATVAGKTKLATANYQEEKKDNSKEEAYRKALCKIDRKVEHPKLGIGSVVSYDKKYIEIEYVSGETRKELIEICVQKRLLQLI